MKKNKMMRLASSLLVAVLLTTSVISGTFAKYVTSDDATDSARVAKWGVTLDVSGNLFGQTYIAHDQTNGDEVGTGTISVKSDSNDDVLAPGTKNDGNGLTMSISGQPEVDVLVTTDFDMTLKNWVVDGNFYCPLVFYVNDGKNTTTINGGEKASAEELITAITNAVLVGTIDATDKTKATISFSENIDLALETSIQKSISWSWPFENGVGQANDKDTKLGNWALNGSSKPEISITFTVTVEQVD